MDTRPTNISFVDEDRLQIDWNDSEQREYTFAELRQGCPCATCREKRAAPPEPPTALPVLPVLSAAEAQPLKVLGMNPVGNYAYSIAFSDGHDTGIFSFELLRKLGRVVS